MVLINTILFITQLLKLIFKRLHFKQNSYSKKIEYPFLISCMTGGTEEAENINQRLAVIAEELRIPIGVGSQRQALENKDYHNSYKIIRKTAKSVPVFGNIGAAQMVQSKNLSDILSLVDQCLRQMQLLSI